MVEYLPSNKALHFQELNAFMDIMQEAIDSLIVEGQLEAKDLVKFEMVFKCMRDIAEVRLEPYD